MDGGGEGLVAQLEVGGVEREARDLGAVPVFVEVDPGPKLRGECREGCLAPPHRSSDGLAVADGTWGPATEEDEAVSGLIDKHLENGALLSCATGASPSAREGVKVLFREYMKPEYDAQEGS